MIVILFAIFAYSNAQCGSVTFNAYSTADGSCGTLLTSTTNTGQNPPCAPASTYSSLFSSTAGVAVVYGTNSATINVHQDTSCSMKVFATTMTSGVCQTITFPGQPARDYKGTFVVTGSSCSSGECFHETTEINYNGKLLTMEQLESDVEPECTIPHVVLSNGVAISARCASSQVRKLYVLSFVF